MDYFENNYINQARPTFQYLIDMLDFYGKNEEGAFKIFLQDSPEAFPVYGQIKTQNEIYQNLNNFQEEGFNNKFILLVGPNGSSKSSIVRKLLKGAEDYSETAEGTQFTFSWIFPIDNFVKGTLGLATTSSDNELDTFAYLEDKDISAILNSELKDHPLLLIPKKQRHKILTKMFKDQPERLESIRKSYLFKGDLSKRNRLIFDALLKNHKGDYSEVYKYIRVERYVISKRYSTAAATIEPQMHVDARLNQITMDKRLANLPPSLQSLNLFSSQGEIIMANRGLLEYSDLLKRPLDTYKYLLMTMESGTINLGGILTELDIFFIGTSNEVHLAAFKQHPDFNSFKGRMNFIRVPYLLNYKHEEEIYKEQIHGLESTSFEPGALNTLCLFAIMTRVRSCQGKNYEDKKLSTIVTGLNPLEKCMLLTNHEVPKRLNIESQQILKHKINEVGEEFRNENLYEGKFGLSPRDIKNLIYDIASKQKHITFIEILEYLEKLITKKNEYDFLNMTPQGDFHHPIRFISLIKEYQIEQFDEVLRECLGMIDDRSYHTHVKRYIENINSLLKGEKVKNIITGKYEVSDEYFINEFEKSIDLKEEVNEFRSQLISKLGAWYLDTPDTDINYSLVFPDLIQRLQESFRNEQKRYIQELSKSIVFFEAELIAKEKVDTPVNANDLTKDNREKIAKILENLIEKYHYSELGAISLIKYLVKEKY